MEDFPNHRPLIAKKSFLRDGHSFYPRITSYNVCYTKLLRRGMLEKIFVREAIKQRTVNLIPESMAFGELVQTMSHSSAMYFPVVNQRNNFV